jgi:hypothetical protein
MKTQTIVAIILLSLGVVVLAYSGISFSTPGRPIDFFGAHFDTRVDRLISPVAGAIALVGGIVLLLVAPRKA